MLQQKLIVIMIQILCLGIQGITSMDTMNAAVTGNETDTMKEVGMHGQEWILLRYKIRLTRRKFKKASCISKMELYITYSTQMSFIIIPLSRTLKMEGIHG